MPGTDEQTSTASPAAARRRIWPRRWRTRITSGVAIAALIGGTAAWTSRERLAADAIDAYLADHGVPATYAIVAIGPQVQVIENLVIGDPARPDLTAERVEVELGLGWAGPEVLRVTVTGARAFGTLRGGRLSLGALDPLIFTGSAAPTALPAINIVLHDARAQLVSDYGTVGLKLDGAGRVDDGFAGTIAATAPGIGVDGCRAGAATLYGKLAISDGAPQLEGPLRLGALDCGGARLARADIGTVLTIKPDFSGADGRFQIAGRQLAYRGTTGESLSGTAQLSWSGASAGGGGKGNGKGNGKAAGGLALAHDLALTNLAAPQGRIARVAAEGAWRGAVDGGHGAWEGTLRAAGIAPARPVTASLAAAARGVEGTLLAPLLAKAQGSLARALAGGTLSADALIRHTGSDAALTIPQAVLASRTGTRVLAASQISAGIGRGGITALRGNLLAGGEGLPSLNGRMEQVGTSGWALRLAMAEYAAGTDRLAIPRLTLRQKADGALQFDGLVTASGALPGGSVRGLEVPVDGTWSSARGLAVGARCLPLRFAALEVSGLALAGQALTLCPERGGPMLAYATALRVGAVSTAPVTLSGTIGTSPATLMAERIALRYPAPFALSGLAARIGEPGSQVRLAAASLTGSLAGETAGAFAGATAQLDAVPLDLAGLAGRWAYADGVLRVSEGAFTLTDRPAAGASARFNPLTATGARLALEGNRITADAALRHPASSRTVAEVALAHDLGDATGNARLAVPGIMFDKKLQPEDLSTLAKGVIALADGTVSGAGRFDWTAETITSSGAFGSAGVDFAAAFGPVRGLAGQVAFTDLLNLTTAPDQRVTIAAINPGVEVLGGTVQFDVTDGTLLRLDDARFPFMGGELRMRPLAMDFSQPEERRYVFDITGLDAATFVAQMELTNLGATGVFDGTVPVIFDANGFGRIDGGALQARAGGGNLAYIGDLTYEDLGAMGNYAFSALRSLDYRQMRITLSGDLAGELITRFDFDGVRQGAGTSRNFITRRLARLPIQFNVNVRSQTFSQLALIARGAFDPTAWGDPFALGLLRYENGQLIRRERRPVPPVTAPAPQSVQPPESDPLP